MFYRHWLLPCFPEILFDVVPIQVGRLHEALYEHDVWNLAGAGDGPLHHLLQSASWPRLQRHPRRQELQDQDGRRKKPVSWSLFPSERTAALKPRCFAEPQIHVLLMMAYGI